MPRGRLIEGMASAALYAACREKKIERKYYWIWAIVIVMALLPLGIIGILLAVLGYYLWSRHISL